MTKINLNQLSPLLSKKLAPFYMIAGDEILLKQDALYSLRKAAKTQGYTERTRLMLETGLDNNMLYSLLYARSLLAEKSVLELDCRQMLPNASIGALLKDYGEKPNPDVVLIIDLAKVDDKIARSAWFKALEKKGTLINIWPLTREQLPAWIINRAKKYKLTFNNQAIDLLVSYTEGNLIALSQALEKLYLLQPPLPLTVEMIQSILIDESQFTLFDFVENLIAGEKHKIMHTLKTLQSGGTEPTLLVWGIARELRLLAEYSKQLNQGISLDTLFQTQRIFSKRQKSIKQFLSKFTSETCYYLLSRLMIIDRVIKGEITGNVWDHLQIFCLRFLDGEEHARNH